MAFCLRVALCLALGLCCVAQSRADEADAVLTYEALLERALAAYEAQQLDEALRFFEQAHALDANARTLRGIGIVQLQRGRPVDAILALEASLEHTRRPLTPELEVEVTRLLVQAQKGVTRLTLQSSPATTRVILDGQAPVYSSAGQLLVAPGAHALRVEAEGFVPQEREVVAGAGERQTLRVVLRAEPPPVMTLRRVNGPATRRAQPDGTRKWTTRTLAAAGVATGVVAFALSMTARIRFATIRGECRALEGCATGLAERRFEEEKLPGLLWSARSLALVSAVSAGAGFGLWLHARRRLALDVALAPNAAVLHGRF